MGVATTRFYPSFTAIVNDRTGQITINFHVEAAESAPRQMIFLAERCHGQLQVLKNFENVEDAHELERL